MKVSSYSKYKGDNGVCITRYKPMHWCGEVYPYLCPSSSLLLAFRRGKISQSDFERLYRKEVLKNLDAKGVYSDLKGKVLLTPDGEIFLFKYIIADWIEEELGIVVERI